MSTPDEFFDTPAQHDPLEPEEPVEFFECAYCGEYNLLKATPGRRRTKYSHHLRADPVTWGSLKRYASINNVDMNNAIKLLLYQARTNNISYLINERKLVESPNKRKQLAKGKHKNQ